VKTALFPYPLSILDRRMHGHDVDTKDLHAVRRVAAEIHRELFPSGQADFVDNAFKWATEAFSGNYGDFQKIDAKYHDFEHTLQGTLAFARLLRGYHRARATPSLTQRGFELGLIAILLHDTGYLKRRSDTEGTGAKYTLVHVSRSADFAGALLQEKGFSTAEIKSVQNMIRCTGVNADLSAIPFSSDLERVIGYALATADLLGQMAAPDYIAKLHILYQEFEESNRYAGKPTGSGVFRSADDLRNRTPQFWTTYVRPKIDKDFRGLYRYLEGSDGHNPYVDRIEANISQLQRELDTANA
jgi:hypothetical protein